MYIILHELKKEKKEKENVFYFAIVRSLNCGCHEVLRISVLNFCALFTREKKISNVIKSTNRIVYTRKIYVL